ncbi:MAG: hypothetical protein ACRDAO_01400 [Culicoidibacterales bacterium]
MKVKIFPMTSDFMQLSKEMETFVQVVEDDGYRVKDVKYSTEFETEKGELYSAMIIYEMLDFFTS